MKRLAIIGAGDLGQQLAHHARLLPDTEVVGFFDDFRALGSRVDEIAVLGRIDEVEACFGRQGFDQLLVGIGYKHLALRQALYERFSPAIPFARLIHPTAWVDPSAVIEPGAVVYPGCVVDLAARIGANSLLNVGCVVAHHSVIGAGCFLAPGVRVAGFVQVGEQTNLGIGTVIVDHVSIAPRVRTGAGAVVVRSIEAAGLYLGVPARMKEEAGRE